METLSGTVYDPSNFWNFHFKICVVSELTEFTVYNDSECPITCHCNALNILFTFCFVITFSF